MVVHAITVAAVSTGMLTSTEHIGCYAEIGKRNEKAVTHQACMYTRVVKTRNYPDCGWTVHPLVLQF